MAANPIGIVSHGLIHIPVEAQDDPRFAEGSHVQLIPLKPVERPGEDQAKAWAEFRKLRGILAHSDYDPNAELEKEKQRELAEEAGWVRT